MKEQIYFSNVKDGKLQENVLKQIDDDLHFLEGKRITIKISIKKKDRSLDQNRYYFGIVLKCFQDGAKDLWGETVSKEQAHETLKVECNYSEYLNKETGEILRIPQRTSNLTTIAFEDYLEKCRQFIFEWFQIVVALPNEQSEIDLSKTVR